MGGQQTTHVANKYREDIYVKVDGDRRYVTLQNVDVSREVSGGKGPITVGVSDSVGVKTEYDWQYAEKNGYTRIKSNDYLGFNPQADTGVVYVTIISASGRVICHCYPKTEDYSVIVNEEGYVKETEYGHLWVEKK